MKVDDPPVPKPEPPKAPGQRLLPAVTTQPAGPDVPTWALALLAAALLMQRPSA